MIPRRGLTLAELLVALVVLGLVLALAADTVRRQTRAHAALAVGTARRDALAASAALLRLQLRGVDARVGDVRLAGDTAVDLRTAVAGAVACAVSDHRLVLAPVDQSSPAPLGHGVDDPAPGDALLLLVDSAGTPRWLELGAAGAPTGASASECPGWLRDAGPARAVALAVPPPTWAVPLVEGAPVRVLRWRRWVTYHAADGAWWVGERPCAAPGDCAAVQPVAGPLAPAESGFHATWEDAGGTALAGEAPPIEARALVVRLRAAPHPLRPRADSLVLRVALLEAP